MAATQRAFRTVPEVDEVWEFANDEPTDLFEDFLAARRARLATDDADADPADSLPRWPAALVEDAAFWNSRYDPEPLCGPRSKRAAREPEAALPPAAADEPSSAFDYIINPERFRERWLDILRRLGPLPFTRWKIMDYQDHATFEYIGPPDRWTPSGFTLTYDDVYDGTASGLFDRMGFAP